MSVIVRGRLSLSNFLVISVVVVLSLAVFATAALASVDSPDSYPPNPTADIPWNAGLGGVADVKSAFNYGRIQENTQLSTSMPLINSMPSQAEWDAMSDNQKALWLVNSERQARGLMPLHGFESNVISVAQNYADWLLDNDKWGHYEDGKNPGIRLGENTVINGCHDDSLWMENLAAFATSGNSIPLPVERAVYNWLFDDSKSTWLHRQMILYYPFNDNSDGSNKEGFMGIGRANGKPYTINGKKYNFGEVIVMNAFDPCQDWQYAAPPPPPWNGTIYLPILLNSDSSPTRMLTGKVTYKGIPEFQTPVELRYFNGSSESTIASDQTDQTGEYEFTNLPSLSGDQFYYARMVRNSTDTSRLASWSCWTIDAATTDAGLFNCDFDTENVSLNFPESGDVTLPQTFSWGLRSTLSDNYAFSMADINTNNPNFEQKLGYNNNYTLYSLPPGFIYVKQYGWWVRVFGPDGWGDSFYYNWVTFNYYE